MFLLLYLLSNPNGISFSTINQKREALGPDLFYIAAAIGLNYTLGNRKISIKDDGLLFPIKKFKEATGSVIFLFKPT
jgi:hypothetical protein